MHSVSWWPLQVSSSGPWAHSMYSLRNSTEGATVCSICSPGTFSLPETTSCTACGDGEYQSSSSAGSCLPCAAGYFSVRVSSTQGASRCSPCGFGSISPTGASSCRACDSGTYSRETNGSSCAICTPSTFSVRNGSNGASGCTDCQAGKFAENPHSTNAELRERS